jgi:prepilin-type N-terminal cleavage/methylation domain-containing protein
MSGPRDDDDAGFTLLELMVASSVMGVVMAIFLAGVLQMTAQYRSSSTLREAQAQAGRAFDRLDAQLRYAADLRTLDLPATGSTRPSLLYLISVPTAGCFALSLVGDRLERRRWAPGGQPAQPEVLANGLSQAGSTDPFTVRNDRVVGTGDGDRPTLVAPLEAVVTVNVTSGAGTDSRQREVRQVFVAPNSVRGPQGVSLDACLE